MAPRRPKIVSGGIPDLPQEELLARAFKVKRVGLATDGKLHFVESMHIDRVQPDRGMDADAPHVREMAKGLKPLVTMSTTHCSALPGYFTPSVKEVLAQIPADLLDQVVAYRIEYGGKGERANTDCGRTTLYTGTLPDHIAKQPVVLNGIIYRPPEPPPPPQDIPVMKPIRLKPRRPGM